MFKKVGSPDSLRFSRARPWTEPTEPTELYRENLVLGQDFQLDEGVLEGADFCIAHPINTDGLPRYPDFLPFNAQTFFQME